MQCFLENSLFSVFLPLLSKNIGIHFFFFSSSNYTLYPVLISHQLGVIPQFKWLRQYWYHQQLRPPNRELFCFIKCCASYLLFPLMISRWLSSFLFLLNLIFSSHEIITFIFNHLHSGVSVNFYFITKKKCHSTILHK